jgi:hypothetical protein
MGIDPTAAFSNRQRGMIFGGRAASASKNGCGRWSSKSSTPCRTPVGRIPSTDGPLCKRVFLVNYRCGMQDGLEIPAGLCLRPKRWDLRISRNRTCWLPVPMCLFQTSSNPLLRTAFNEQNRC